MKKWLSILLIFVLSFGVSVNVFAYEGDGIDPTDDNDYSWELDEIEGTPKLERWSYTSSTSQALSIKNGKATMTASVTGYQSKATKVIIYMYLQQSKSTGGWKNLASFKDSFDRYYGSAEHTYSPCETGHTYRLMCSYYVYSGDKYEHIIAYSKDVNY